MTHPGTAASLAIGVAALDVARLRLFHTRPDPVILQRVRVGGDACFHHQGRAHRLADSVAGLIRDRTP